MNQNSSVRKLARCAVVAAIYVVLCMALQPFSYGAVQVRVAEALCLLPVFGPEYIAGVVLGCFLANLLGSTIVDVIFGTLATLLACLVTYKLRDLRFKGLALAASLPPVLFNAVIIGIEIAVLFPDPSSSAPLWLACITNGISVGMKKASFCCSAFTKKRPMSALSGAGMGRFTYFYISGLSRSAAITKVHSLVDRPHKNHTFPVHWTHQFQRPSIHQVQDNSLPRCFLLPSYFHTYRQKTKSPSLYVFLYL